MDFKTNQIFYKDILKIFYQDDHLQFLLDLKQIQLL